MINKDFEEFNLALKQLHKSASQMGIGVEKCAEALQSLARTGAENTVMPGDSLRNKFKTLNVKHEARN